MGTKYGTILVGGVVQTYNDDAPNDNAEQTEANRVKYVTVTSDLSSPLHSAITRMDGKLLDQVDEGPTPKSSAYTTTLADHNSVIECTGTFTLDLLAVSGNAGYKVIAKNAGSGVITVEVDGGGNIDGAASVSLIAGEAREFRVNNAGTAYYSTSGAVASLGGSSVITTQGDLIRGDSGGDEERVALGTSGQVLGSDGTDAAWADRVYRGTPQATTSGTAFDFTSIPAWINHILVLFNAVSLSGADSVLVQIGDSGGIETTGYASTGLRLPDSNPIVASSSTAGFIIADGAAGFEIIGALSISRIDGNDWISSHNMRLNAAQAASGSGSKSLSGTLTQLRITRDGSDTFDAGSVNIIGW